MIWKTEKEKEMKCFYCKPTGTKKRSNYQKEYYICHRSYVQEKYKSFTYATTSKVQSAQGFVKLMYSCPSTIEVIVKEDHHKVTIFTPHIGHDCSLKHLNLSALERTQIAGLLI